MPAAEPLSDDRTENSSGLSSPFGKWDLSAAFKEKPHKWQEQHKL
jgi:hypothetical protein